MVDDLLFGRVTSFRREQGFGVITLDDGTEVKFDASACTMIPEEGAGVRLRVGPAKWGGGMKALHVEPRGSSTLMAPAPPATLDQQIAALQREHLVGGLSEHVMAQLVAEVFDGQVADATLLDVLDAFYVQDASRARHDGYLRHDRHFHHATDDILADIAAQLPGARLPRQVSWTPRVAFARSQPGATDTGPWHRDRRAPTPVESAPREPLGTLVARLPDGSERVLEVESLDDIIALANEALREASDVRRLYALDTAGDWHATIVLASDRAKRLARILPFATSPQVVN